MTQESESPLSRGDAEPDRAGRDPAGFNEGFDEPRLRPRRWRWRNRLFLLFGTLALGVCTLFLWRYFASYESTDDAQVDAHLHPVSARVRGHVTRVNVDDNEFVKKGAVLVEIDPKDYQVAVDQAKADLETAEAAAESVHIDVPITATTTSSQLESAAADVDKSRAAVAAAEARAVQRGALATLLPDVTGTITTAVEQVSLATLGFQSAKGLPPGFQFGRILGPFNYFDAGAVLRQRVSDLTAIRNYRSTKEIALSTAHTVRDNRDLVVLAVGGAYLQIVAAAARVDSARAQVETARAVYTQATRQNEAGVNARIDVDRSQVEWQTQRLRLISLETDLASQKLVLGRIIGLPLGQEITLTTNMEYAPEAEMSLQKALTTAFANRADLQAAEAQVRAATEARKAAQAQNFPALAMNGSYLVAGVNPAQSNGVFSVFATVDFPIWRGGRIQADVAAADAVYTQRRAEYEDVRGRVDFEVRTAFLHVAATNEQVAVAESSRVLARNTLRQARDRFGAGVADTVEVVQAQESVATAEQDYIASLHAHYLAKLSVARAIGDTEQGIALLLQPGHP